MSLELAKDYFNSRNYKKCLKILNREKKELDEKDFLYLKIKSLFYLRRSKTALSVVKKALKKRDRDLDFYLLQLEIYVYNYKNRIKQVKSLIEIIEAIDSSARTNCIITHYIGILEFRKGNFIDAQKMFEASLALDMGNSTVFTAENIFLLGFCYYKNYDYRRLKIVIDRYSISNSPAIKNHISLLKMIYRDVIDTVVIEDYISWARSNVYHNFVTAISITKNFDNYSIINKNKNNRKIRKKFRPYKLGYL